MMGHVFTIPLDRWVLRIPTVALGIEFVIFYNPPNASTPTNLRLCRLFTLLTHPIAIGLGLINPPIVPRIRILGGWAAWPQLIARWGITLRQKVKSRDKAMIHCPGTGGQVTFCRIIVFPPHGPTTFDSTQLIYGRWVLNGCFFFFFFATSPLLF